MKHVVKEYDAIEGLSDHDEWTPPIPRGTRGVIVDLPEASRITTVEFALPEETAAYLFHTDDLRVVEGWIPQSVFASLQSSGER